MGHWLTQHGSLMSFHSFGRWELLIQADTNLLALIKICILFNVRSDHTFIIFTFS